MCQPDMTSFTHRTRRVPVAEAEVDLGGLMQAVAAGDYAAFREIYRLTSPQLYALALRQTRRNDVAQDVLQEVFTAAWLRAETYDAERGTVLSWFAGIVRNRVKDRHRRRRLNLVQIDEARFVAAEEMTPLDRTVAVVDGIRARAALAQLPDNMRRVIELAYFDGATYPEIAERLGVPLNTAKSWVRRALPRLRRLLETQDGAGG
jgi:RNA polymerase sigma-70 factor (ECF subfamily)